MTKIALIAAVCCAFAAPAFARGGTTVVVKTVNVSGIQQGGNGTQANAAIVAQGTVAIVQAPEHSPTISNNVFGFSSVGGR